MVFAQKSIANRLRHKSVAKWMIWNLIITHFRNQVNFGKKNAFRHELVNGLDDAMDAILWVVVLVEVNNPNLALLHILCTLNQVYLPLVVNFVGVAAGHVECFIFTNPFLLHNSLHFFISDAVTGHRIK